MKALVLGGGSLKGSWQLGVAKAVIESGFKPDMIYGISAGALNGSYMVSAAGKYEKENIAINWTQVIEDLEEFWHNNISKPEDIGILKSKFSLGIDTLFSRFDGLLDTEPLYAKIKHNISLDNLRKSTVKLKIGAVDINSGLMHYLGPDEEHFHDYLRASSSIPIIMPGIQIGGDHKKVFLDGGLREVVPLKKAIEDGATDIYAIATHTQHPDLSPVNYRSLLSLIERMKDISVNQFENSDLEWAERLSKDLVSVGDFTIKKKLNIKVIRPQKSLNLDLTKFTIKDIKRNIQAGYEEGLRVIS